MFPNFYSYHFETAETQDYPISTIFSVSGTVMNAIKGFLVSGLIRQFDIGLSYRGTDVPYVRFEDMYQRSTSLDSVLYTETAEDNTNVVLSLFQGDDLFNLGNKAEYANANNGDDVINGGGGADTLYGASGEDLLSGEGGRDKLFGGRHEDTLLGGAAYDVLRAVTARMFWPARMMTTGCLAANVLI